MDVTGFIYTAVTLAIVIGFFVAKHWIKRDIHHEFDSKLEALRSDLRTREAEISALRDGVLSGLANRQALVDKRRLEAINGLWSAFLSLAPLAAVAMQMSVFKFEVAARDAPNRPELRRIFQMMGKNVSLEQLGKSPARLHQPFVTPTAWAFFSAYQSVVVSAVVAAKVLELGIPEPHKYFDQQKVKDVLKAALPHQEKFIDDVEFTAHYYLLEELEKRLLGEIHKMLAGTEIDAAHLAQSVKIMEAVSKVRPESLTKKVSDQLPGA